MRNIFKIIVLLTLSLLSTSIRGQFSIYNKDIDKNIERIEVDTTFYSSSNIYKIYDSSISGLCVTADIELYNYESYVRIILVDLDYDKEYLIYDAYYPMNSIDTKYSIEEFALETNMLYNISNAIIKIEVNNAECFIGEILYSTYNYNNRIIFDTNKNIQKHIQDSLIIKSMNERILNDDMIWVAGKTSVSKMFYDERRYILPKNDTKEIPNLQGLEYYTGGVFVLHTDSVAESSSEKSNYVDNFDWRNRHGTSWITSSKQQYCNQCWVFCPTSVAESSVNLYFNRHIDYDLSEQNLASCSGGNSGNCEGGYINSAVSYLIENGIVDEVCFPYEGGDVYTVPCSNICDAPNEIISFITYNSIPKTIDNIKESIITRGPICGGISNIWHFMSIIGFKKLKNGDVIYDGNGSSLTSITINETSPYLNQTCWLFKNSWGTNWGDNGCGYIITNTNNLYGLYELISPESLQYDNDDILCLDIDGDGYYNWGIGPKPENCPECPDVQDCDDSDPTIGPFDENYECISICDLPYSNDTIKILTSTLWNNNNFYNRSIEIVSPAVLTITSTIWLCAESKIIIHPGAKLVIDGGILTNPCGNLWRGIQVWGNDSIHQHTINGQCHQGILEMKNGATIENAVCAVELWQPNNYHSEGGIIHAEDAVFRNNAKSVHAINYTNFNPVNGNELSYNASFNNCSFVIDTNYIGEELFYKHVDLDRVNGISFRGCSFSADRNVPQVSQWCSGIAAYSAGFSVDSYCDNSTIYPCPDENLIRSSFTGFQSGIYTANNSSSARTFSVKNSTFTGNERGIYAENTGYATIIKNDFNVGTNANCNFGIYANGVTGFCIEENNFFGNTQSANDTYGVAIHNSGYNNNDVYFNSFNNLTCGNIAIGSNRKSGTLASTNQRGLAYFCNTNSGNLNDFCVIKDESSSVNGIARSQGSSSQAAANTFSASQYHFYNNGDDMINYYYNSDGNQQPLDSKTYRVTSIATQNSNDCESHYGGTSVVKPDDEMMALENSYQTSLSAYNSLEQLYTSRIDGGDTQAEVNDINTATADDAMRLRSQLLGHSPYLSQEVLTTAASRDDVFSSSVLFEILSANPDELKKDTLISYLENKDNPMPEYMTELLREIANGTTARTALESQMAKTERDYILAAGDIVRSNLNAEETDNEELREWLGNMNDMASDRLAIASYIQEGDFDNALALAELLPNIYGLQGSALEEHDDYVAILRLYETLDESGRDILQLTGTETAMIEEIADNGSGSSQMMASAIIEQNGATIGTRISCPTLPSMNNNSKRGNCDIKTEMAAAMGMKASLSPNPASAWTEIDFTLPAEEKRATFVITNALGLNVMTTELIGNQGRMTLNIEKLPAGVYTYSLRCGEYVVTGKLMKK